MSADDDLNLARDKGLGRRSDTSVGNPATSGPLERDWTPGPPEFETGSDVEIARALVHYLRTHFTGAVFCEGSFYVWKGSCWGALSEPELRKLVHPYNGAPIVCGRKIEHLRLNKGRVDGTLCEAAAMLDAPGFFASARQGINCANGLLLVDGYDAPILEPHHPDHRLRHCLNMDFDSTRSWYPPEGSLLETLLNGCIGADEDAADKIDLLAETCGAVVLGMGTKLTAPKCIVLLGETAENGKSQFLAALKGLVPAEAVSTITPQQMGHEQYRAQLAGKLLNVSDELGAAAITSDTFKAIITGDPVTAKTVYRQPVSIEPWAQHVFSTNRLPQFAEGMDRGVRRRLLPIVFARTIPEQARIARIGERIAANEASILLAFAVYGAQRLLRHGTFTVPLSSRQALGRWFLEGDPVIAFLQDEEAVEITGSYSDRVTSKVAYRAFQIWALSEGIRGAQTPQHAQFTARVKEAGLSDISVRRRGKSGTCFHGLRIAPQVKER